MGIVSTELALGVATLGFFIYVVTLSIYRLYFSPIAKFPGPRLAALTLWYEFYHDFIRRGQYEFEIAEMHKQYGPIVRISPFMLHIDDPEYIDTLYPGTGGNKVDKWDWVMKMFGNELAGFATSPHELHRRRRAAISPLFSKRSVAELEPFIRYYIDKLAKRLEGLRGSGTPVNIVDCYSSLTGDIIADYCFGKSQGFLDTSDFAPHWHKTMVNLGEFSRLTKQFGWILPVMQSLPDKVVELLNPDMSVIPRLHASLRTQVNQVLQERAGQNQNDMKGPPHRTIFHEVLDSNLPDEEKTLMRMIHEGSVLMTGGTTTTADTLAVITFYLLRNPDFLQRLQLELSSAMSSKTALTDFTYPPLRELEQLPYLTAIIKEGLRCNCGVVQRLARIHPDVDLEFQEWKIPRGTPVGMSCWMVHTNPSLFPEPHAFKPERWLDEQKTTPNLEKYILSFSKGTRQCVALNLAWAEMYLSLAAIFAPNRFQFELFETDDSDVEFALDSFMPQVKEDSKGIRVVVN